MCRWSPSVWVFRISSVCVQEVSVFLLTSVRRIRNLPNTFHCNLSPHKGLIQTLGHTLRNWDKPQCELGGDKTLHFNCIRLLKPNILIEKV